MSTASFIRASAAAATLGTLVAGSALFALPAAADTSGYQTGYQYTQGLAIGDGAMLMSEAGSGTAVPAASTGVPSEAAGTGVTDNTTAPTTATTPIAQTSVAPAANTQTAVAPAAAPAATGMSAAMIAGWAALGLAIILILAAIWSFFAQERVSRTRRTTTVYQ